MALVVVATPAHAFLEDNRDGILFIQVVGGLPTGDDIPDAQGEDDDGDKLDITSNAEIQNECFERYAGATINFDLIVTDTTWGGGVDRVEIGGRPASDFGFMRGETTTSGIDCVDVEPQWHEYGKPGFGFLLVLGNNTLTVEAGAAGTEVRLEDGFELQFLSGSSLVVEGTPDKPVVFRGTQWPGINIGPGASADLTHCVFRDARGKGALRVGNGAEATIAHCEFDGNEGQFGGAVRVAPNASIEITDTVFTNSEATRGGGLFIEGSAPFGVRSLSNVVFEGNEALRGGGLYLDNGGTVDLNNVSFVDNESGRGGGLSIVGGITEMRNPVMVGNTGRIEGGGLRIGGGATVNLYNPTIAYNEAARGGGIEVLDAASVVSVNNGIIWGNALRPGGSAPQVGNAGSVALNRVLLQGGLAGGYEGPAPIPGDLVDGVPGFRSVPEAAGAGEGSAQADFRLSSSSEVINVGNDARAHIAHGDRAGNPRIFGHEQPQVDLGAYEFPNNPPTLLSTTTVHRTMDERDGPILLELCASYGDLDSHAPDYHSTRSPWLTRAPGADQIDPDDPFAAAERPYGEMRRFDGGEPGDSVRDDSALGDASGRVYFDPANRSHGYAVTIECRVRDQLTDMEGEVEETLSMLSHDSQSAVIQVTGANQPPSFQGIPASEARVGSEYDEELRFLDSDVDHRERDLDVRLISGPAWLGLRRTDDDVVVLSGNPPDSGEFDVVVEAVDPSGGTDIRVFTITVDDPSALEPVVAGGDHIAEPGDRVRLSADGPDDAGVSYLWRIVDDGGTEVASQEGRHYTWTAQQGLYQAIVSIEAGQVVDEDRLSITVEDGFDGTAGDPGARSGPSAGEIETLDDMAAGDPAWTGQSDADKAEALASLARADLSEPQQDAVLAELDTLLANATTPIGADLAADLAAAYGGLAGLELDPGNELEVIARAEDLRVEARADLDDAGYAAVLGALSSAALDPTMQDTLLGELAALRANASPITEDLAADLARAYGGLARLGLDAPRRAEVLGGAAALRADAHQADVTGDLFAAGLIEAGSGVSAADPLGAQELVGMLEGLTADLDDVADRDGSLDGVGTNLALAAVANASRSAQFADPHVEPAADVIEAVLDTGALSATRLAMAATIVAAIADRTSRAGHHDRLERVLIGIGRRSIEEPVALTVVGGTRLKLATGAVPGGAGGGITVGNEAPPGPRLFVPGAAVTELRNRNGLLGPGDGVGFMVIARRPAGSSNYAVEIYATGDDGQTLGDTELASRVRATIPRTSGGGRVEPRATDGAPASVSNIDAEARGVSFDTDRFGRYALATSVDPGSGGGGGGSDKSSCFLDSLF